ncbi:hypothetical protein [Actinokineospora enzanensis]|uniref:hypothetical protein n=1 Tax=Actinokineospora enzanensis TaxID=155975 RepID=UPI00036B7AEF|nr:hypothetical protein [Actinokineospora enzanensis]
MVKSDVSALSSVRFDTRVRVHGTSEFHGALAVSADEMWAVGGTVDPGTGLDVALVGRWGQDFRFVPPADSGQGVRLFGVDQAGEDVWAVGRISDGRVGSRPRIERHARHTDSATAVDVPAVDHDSALHDVAMLSATEGWAVGGSGPDTDFSHNLIVRWDGTGWNEIPCPNPGTATNRLDAVAARASDDVWAVGHSGDGTHTDAVVLHWDGSAWSQVAIPGAEIELLDVAVVAHDSVWVVGTTTAPGKSDEHVGVVLHWNGSTWTDVLPDPTAVTQMTGIAVLGPDDIWFAGYAELPGLPDTEHLAHWDGTRLRDEAPAASTTENVASALHRICAVGDRLMAVGWRASSTDPAARSAAALLGRTGKRA